MPLVLLESCWIVFGNDDAALRAAAEPHISLTHVFNSYRTLLFAVLTSQVTSQSPLFFLIRRAAPMSYRDAAQKEKPPYSDPRKFRTAANFMDTLQAKTNEVCGNRDSNSEPKQATYEAWEAWILPLNHCRGEDYQRLTIGKLYSHKNLPNRRAQIRQLESHCSPGSRWLRKASCLSRRIEVAGLRWDEMAGAGCWRLPSNLQGRLSPPNRNSR